MKASLLLLIPVLLGILQLRDVGIRMTDVCASGPSSFTTPDGERVELPRVELPCHPEEFDEPVSWRWPAIVGTIGSDVIGSTAAWVLMPELTDLDRRTRQRRAGRVRIRPTVGARLAMLGLATAGAVVAVNVGGDPDVESSLLEAGCATLLTGCAVLSIRTLRWGVEGDPRALVERRLLWTRTFRWPDLVTRPVVRPIPGAPMFGGLAIHIGLERKLTPLYSVWRWDTRWSRLLLETWAEQLGDLRASSLAGSGVGEGVRREPTSG